MIITMVATCVTSFHSHHTPNDPHFIDEKAPGLERLSTLPRGATARGWQSLGLYDPKAQAFTQSLRCFPPRPSITPICLSVLCALSLCFSSSVASSDEAG